MDKKNLERSSTTGQIKKKKSSGQSGDDGNTELRTKIVQIYFSPTEYLKLNGYFNNSPQTTLANFCREKLLSKPGSSSGKKEILAEISYSIYQLSKIGNSLNQIARKVNSIKKDYPELLNDLKIELDELKQANKSMLSKFKKVGD